MPADHNMKTWLNLQELKFNGTDGAPMWMQDDDSSIWNGIKPPTLRKDWELCSLVGCAGASIQVLILELYN